MDSDVRKWVLIGIIGAGLFFMSGVLLALVINRNNQSPMENQQLIEESLQASEEATANLQVLEKINNFQNKYWFGKIKNMQTYTGIVAPTSSIIFYYPDDLDPDLKKDIPAATIYQPLREPQIIKAAEAQYKKMISIKQTINTVSTPVGKAVQVGAGQWAVKTKNTVLLVSISSKQLKKSDKNILKKLRFEK